ncbi:Malonyl CoA-acyl carrier protein transacylase [Bacillus subtilis]|nr:Malonyl CoA-acyl carrier protein transacylase [Bacillus subtilis]RPK27097.1 Malonyl CoA-acyl carrier protein transacylase [Bacillus subtilis]
MFDSTNVKDIYKLSPMQEGMLFHTINDQDGSPYFDQMVLDITGDVNLSYLENSFKKLIEKYDILRTVFLHENVKHPLQVVFKKRDAEVEFYNVKDLEEIQQEEYINNFLKKDRERGFDLSRDLLMRLSLIKIADKRYHMILSSHHILMDGWCQGIVLNDLFEMYQQLNQKKPIVIEKVTPYSEYINWLKKQNEEEARLYWKEYLNGYEAAASLPKQTTRDGERNAVYEEMTFVFSEELTSQLTNLTKTLQVTMNTVFQTIWGILLQRYNNTRDIVFGSVVSGRPPEIPNVENIVGLFINTIPVRIQSEREHTFIELVKQIQEASLASRRYDYLSLAEIQSMSELSNQLINHIVAFENYPMDESFLEDEDNDLGFVVTSSDVLEEPHFDFVMQVTHEETLEVTIRYNSHLYNKNIMENISGHMEQIVLQVTSQEDILVDEIEILKPSEKQTILFELNNTDANFPDDKTIHQLFEEQVLRTPNRVALVCEGNKLTYNELNEQANQLARVLREKGVGPEKIVGIKLNRSIDMVVGILAILKAGGAYLPIDPEYAVERIQFMLEDSKAHLLIVSEQLDHLARYKGEILNLASVDLNKQGKENLERFNRPQDLAYIIYTSGSTGKPKGVMIEHRNVIRLLFNNQNKFDFNENDVWTVFHSFCFDFSVWEMYGALLNGGKAIIVTSLIARDTKRFLELLSQEKVTVLNQTPTAFYQLISEHIGNYDERNLDLRYIIFGGEALAPYKLKDWKNRYPEMKLVNMYGITETTVHVTYKEIGEHEIEANISDIGKPIPTLKTYVLDHLSNPVPIGVAGELYVSGEGVARGYLNQEELTKERFLDNPLVPNERMYKSGDLVRWLPDGNLEYLGRLDTQVKIRGHRIEIKEIETALLLNSVIQEVVVVARKDEQHQDYLCAYIVANGQWTVSELRQYLSETLPLFMIPSYFVSMDKIPQTSNGKVNVKALPEPKQNIQLGMKYTSPSNRTESVLIEIWQTILGVDRIGVHDNFYDLGGHSLKATLLISRIHKELDIVVPLRMVFSHPTVKEMANYINGISEEAFENIEPVQEQVYYPVSSAQKRMYIINQLDEAGTNYNMPFTLEIEGELDKYRLKSALSSLINRHESLRTSFHMVDGELMQQVHLEVPWNLIEISSTEEEAKKVIDSFITPFELDCAPLFRAVLIDVNSHKSIFLMDIHHIISDGVSGNVILNDLMAFYQGRTLPKLRIQYKDYVAWTKGPSQIANLKKQEAYWLEQFSSDHSVLELPLDTPRSSIKKVEGNTLDFYIESEMLEKLKSLSASQGSTLYMTLLAGYNVLLSKYSGQDDIIVGTPIAGRNHHDLDSIVGVFINTLAIRNYPKEEKNFLEFLEEVKECLFDAYENADYAFESLIEKLDLKHDLSRHPLFDTMFTLQNLEDTELDVPGIDIKPYDVDWSTSKFDISWELEEDKGGIHVSIEYSNHLFRQETIERMFNHYKHILHQIVEKPNQKIVELQLVTEAEKQQLTAGYNETFSAYTKKTIHQMFEGIVEQFPNEMAVVYGDDKLTYQQLNERANQLARLLRKKGLCREQVVGIVFDRGIDTLVAIIAVLKAGGAYLPIDAEYPKERIEYMIQDSSAQVLIVQDQGLIPANYTGVSVVMDQSQCYQGDVSNLQNINEYNDLAYIIYTSGSTGKPKGVMIEHQGVCNLCLNADILGYEIGSRALQFASISFDASVFEIFFTLLSGATLYMAQKELLLSKADFIPWLKKNEIEIIPFIPPSVLKLFTYEALPSLRTILTAGESCSFDLIQRWGHNRTFINAYGPTEATVCATLAICDPSDETVSIGRPVWNKKIYILNENLQVQPIGVPGELCIGGDGLARGYVNLPELTERQFVDNPFIPGEKIYRTGDLVRWLPNGNIEFLERIDDQVKIRGHRIELGEVNKALLQHPVINEAVVAVKTDKNDEAYLCAYIVADKDWKVAEIRKYLGLVLPQYMMPSVFMDIKKIPLTSNGKLDKKALPEPLDMLGDISKYSPPTNRMERILTEIWSEVLGIEKVGIDDNFFELGGHSLKAMMVVSRIQKSMGVAVSLRELFGASTIKDLSKILNKTERKSYNLKPIEKREYYPISSAQRRMYIVHHLEGQNSSTNYNIPLVFEVSGSIDIKRLQRAVNVLLNRHEALRTSFHLSDEEIVQKISNDVTAEIVVIESNHEDKEDIIDSFIQPFELSIAPLFRVSVARLDTNKALLMIDMHHIISDGVSTDIFMQELIKIYREESLPELHIQYKDYAVWQQSLEYKNQLEKQKSYWLSNLSGNLPILEMPLDYKRPLMQQFEGETYEFEIDRNIHQKLKVLSLKHDTTLFMTMLACYNILLSKYSGQEDIIVGSPIAGRPHPDLESIIGVFINTLAFRNFPQSTVTTSEFITSVKNQVLDAYENADYPFEELVDKLDLRRDLSRHPLFDTMFILQNMDMGEVEIPDAEIEYYNWEWKNAKYDMSWVAYEEEDSIQISIEYSTSLFTRETIERMSKQFIYIIEQVVEKSDLPLASIELITEMEKNQLIKQFNDTKVDFQIDKPIHQIFEDQVAKNPDEIALLFMDKKVTYRELNERANQLARILRSRGIQKEKPVAILLDRSIEMLIAILGVWKAGGLYVPLTPEYPLERMKYMLNDSQAQLLLTQNTFIDVSTQLFVDFICLDNPPIYTGNSSNLEIVSSSSDLAYILYTSGSTGLPKGVLIEHRSICNRIFWMINKYNVTKEDTILFKTPYVFDVSLWEIVTWFFVGGSLSLLPPNGEKSPDVIVETVKNHGVTLLHFVPSMLNLFLKVVDDEEFLNGLSSVKRVFASGEALTREQVSKFRESLYKVHKTTLHNLYGPTEATIEVSYYDCLMDRDVEVIPIGKPISNVELYVFNKDGNLNPIGVPGELYISGICVGRGYLNREELTRERFVPNPFDPEGYMYKTGDLVKRLSDGNIEYLGRMDDQVKVRGYRIELKEIESILSKHLNVREVVVTVQKDEQGDSSLCAYIVSNGSWTPWVLRQYLAQILPYYMIPTYFVELSQLPLTTNGKLDKKRLPKPEGLIQSEVVYEAPTNPIEEVLVGIWKNILNIERLSIHDNFFDSGGHSIKATMLVSIIKKRIGVTVPLREVFRNPVLKDMANYISQKGGTITYSNALTNKMEVYSEYFKEEYELEGELEKLYQIPDYVPIDSYTEREVVIGKGRWAVPGTLTLPKGKGPFATVILVPGDGELDRDSTLYALKPFKDLSLGLASRGFAVLRYEKRTSIHQDYQNYTVNQEFVEDALEALELLKNTEEINPNEIYMLGHCRGGWMLPAIIEKVKHNALSGGIMLSAPVPDMTEIDAFMKEDVRYLLSQQEVMNYREQLKLLEDPNLDMDQPPATFSLEPSIQWWYSLKDYIPGEIAAQQNVPLLILQGGRDLNIPVKNFESWKQILSHREDIEFMLYRKLNHMYVEGEGMFTFGEYMKPANIPKYVIGDIVEWLMKSKSTVSTSC